jgi:hypothetical protein
MKSDELMKQLKSGEYLEVAGNITLLKDNQGRTTAQYIIDSQSNYWPVATLNSTPPSGHFKVKNLYVDSTTGKLVVEYENTPAP